MSIFETLNKINVNEHTEQKNGLTYLSWAWAWQEVKKAYPDATYTVYETESGCNYFTDGKTCWVKTGVTIEGLEHIEYLPVMDYKNKSIPVENVTSYDVNKSIQRSLTKACARHGLGLYIYAGEDLPESEKESTSDAHDYSIDRRAVASLLKRITEVNGADYQHLVKSLLEQIGSKANTLDELEPQKCNDAKIKANTWMIAAEKKAKGNA